MLPAIARCHCFFVPIVLARVGGEADWLYLSAVLDWSCQGQYGNIIPIKINYIGRIPMSIVPHCINIGGVEMKLGHINFHMLGVGIVLIIASQYHMDSDKTIIISIHKFTDTVSSGQHMGWVNQCSGAEEASIVVFIMHRNNPGEFIQTSPLSTCYPGCWPGCFIGLAAVTLLS